MLKFRIKIAAVVFLALAWSYLIEPTLWPFAGLPVLKVVCLSVGILFFALMYRSLEFDLTLTSGDLSVIAAYAAFFALLNSRMLLASIGCDELYHAERAVFYLHGLKFLPAGLCGTQALQNMPITEVNSLISFGIVGAAFAVWFLWSLLRRRVTSAIGRYVVLFLLCTVVGIGVAGLKIPAESHPPLRLLPLFFSQLLFGLQDFSFRLPGVLAMSVVSFFAYRLVRREETTPGWFFPFLVGVSIYMIPTVFHVSVLVQPSIWGFAVAMGFLYAVYQAAHLRDEKYIILASVIIGLGTLLRQNVVLLWPVFFLICFLHRPFIKRWSLVLLPILFMAPYGFTLVRIGHPMAQVRMFERPTEQASTSSASQNVVNSLATGVGPKAIWKSSSGPWVLFTLMGIGFLLVTYRGALWAYYLTFATGYVLCFTIPPELWGVGRYQAEFVAPCMALTIFLLAILLRGRGRALLGCALVYLSLSSFFGNLTFPQDVHYDHWSRKRLSTESIFPYKEALGFLQRQETQGKFIIVGGTSTYGRMILWLRGFNYVETERYWSVQKEFAPLAASPMSLSDFEVFLRRYDVDYFLVEYGDRRERDFRTPTLQSLMDALGQTVSGLPEKEPLPYNLQQTFIGPIEGAIDIYGKPNHRY